MRIKIKPRTKDQSVWIEYDRICQDYKLLMQLKPSIVEGLNSIFVSEEQDRHSIIVLHSAQTKNDLIWHVQNETKLTLEEIGIVLDVR